MFLRERRNLASKIGLASLVFTTFPTLLLAGPVIDEAAFSNSQDLVIQGSAFGNGPTVALHDDFSDVEIFGDSLILKPQVGTWLQDSRSTAINPFIDETHRNTSLYVRGDAFSSFTFGLPDSEALHGLKTFQEVYLSYTVRDLGDFPGTGGTATGFSTQSSTKDAWMMLGDRGDNTAYSIQQGEPAGHDLYVPGWTGGGFNIAGNNTRMQPSYWTSELTEDWAFGGWNTIMFHAELNSLDPYGKAEGFFAFLNKNRYHVNVRDGNFMSDQTGEGVPYPFWDRVKFFKWMNVGDADVNRVVDEIYVAIGENANARVLLTDKELLENSSRVLHLSPKSWTDSEIVVRFPDYLPTNNTYYLHVLDANNRASRGYNLCRNCPKPPQLSPAK